MTAPEDHLSRLLHREADRYQPAPDGLEKIQQRITVRRRARTWRRGALLAGAVAAVAAVGITLPLLAANDGPSTTRIRSIAPASPGPSSTTTTPPSTFLPTTTPPTSPAETAPATTIAPSITTPATPPSTAASPATTAPPTTTTTPSTAVLRPAEAPPIAGVVECNIPITTSEDGNATPLGCPNSGINVAAWNFYVPLARNLLSLGPNATPTQLTAAACSDQADTHTTTPELTYAAQLAGTYYGWPESYSQNLNAQLVQGVCKGA